MGSWGGCLTVPSLLPAGAEGGRAGTPESQHTPPNWTQGLPSLRPATIPRGTATAPQVGASNQACPPEADCRQRQVHSRADTGVRRPKASAASPGHQEYPPLKAGQPLPVPQAQWCTSHSPGPRLATAPGEAHPAESHWGPRTGPVSMRRSSPAWPSSWTLSRSCCPGDCPRVLLQARISSVLEAVGPWEYCRPTLPRKQASAPLAVQLPKPAVGPLVLAQPLLKRHPCQGPVSGSLGGQPLLWVWAAPHSPKREGGTLLSQGRGGRGTVASREEPALQGSFGVLHIPVLILAAEGQGGWGGR
ncbi:hypothetical protein MC885_021146, partial [Smutsia gigantea]